jgi:predicted kinase
MYNTNHFTDITKPAKFHAEGSIWTHTLMTMTIAETLGFTNITLPVMLLHDIGKPQAEETITKKLSEFNDQQLKDRFQVEYLEWMELPDDINISFLGYLESQYGETTSYKRFTGHEGLSTMRAIDILNKMKMTFNISDENIKAILELISLHGTKNEYSGVLRELHDIVRKCDKDGAIRLLSGEENKKYNQYEGRKFSGRSNVQEDKTLTVLCGLPCSGKSTYVNNLNSPYVLSRDTFLIEYYNNKFAYMDAHSKLSTYSDIYKELHKDEESKKVVNEAFNKHIDKVQKSHNNICIDMTMLSLKSRRKMLNKFPKHTAKSIVFMTGLEEIRKRNISRNIEEGKFIPDGVFEGMSKSFTFPVKEEGFVEVEIIL